MAAWLLVGAPQAHGLTSESPEVKQLVVTGLKALEKLKDDRLGAMCLAGLAFLKHDEPNHPVVEAAAKACYDQARQGYHEDTTYNAGIAVIFLAEHDPARHRDLIQFYLNALLSMQKPHGGWGYLSRDTGDTSQTQYVALSFWEAHRHGFKLEERPVRGLLEWITKTQAPNGAWGYQGRVAPSTDRVEQTEMSHSMTSAGMGCLLIAIDLFGLEGPNSGGHQISDLPQGVRVALEGGNVRAPRVDAGKIDRERVLQTLNLGSAWSQKNYSINNGRFQGYYLYALERHKSFEEYITGIVVEDAAWFNDGYKNLVASQAADVPGQWDLGCGPMPDTAFALLFLQRSTQKLLRASIGEGTMFAGRGLPKDLHKIKLQGGQFVSSEARTQIGGLMQMLEDGDSAKLDALADSPESVVVGSIDGSSRRRLEQLARSGRPEVRLLAVRALAEQSGIDQAPTLIHALTDPDVRIARAAHEGLRLTSRRFDLPPLAEGAKDRAEFDRLREQAVAQWKNWYHALRPDAPLSGP